MFELDTSLRLSSGNDEQAVGKRSLGLGRMVFKAIRLNAITNRVNVRRE